MLDGTKIVLSALVLATCFAMGTPIASAVCREPWVDVGSDIARGYLWDVSAVDASNAWAAGVRYDADGNERLLVMRWDGTSWTRESLGFSPLYANMYAVEAVAADDVWASGVYFDEVDDRTELVMLHFDGEGWSVIDAPIAPSQRIKDIIAISSDEIWAVGWYVESGESRPWVLRWNGSTWSVDETAPDFAGEESLYGVDGAGPEYLWAVGHVTRDGRARALALFRGASGWVRVDLPRLPEHVSLSDVTMLPRGVAFASGSRFDGGPGFALRWNGSAWRSMPAFEDAPASINGIDAESGTDVVAIGNVDDGAYVARWDGTAWERMPIPDARRRTAFQVEHAGDAWFLASSIGPRTSVVQRCVPAT